MGSHEGADSEQTRHSTDESTNSQEYPATRDASVKFQSPSQHPSTGTADLENTAEQDSKNKTDSLETLDWKDFEIRYTEAMSKTNELEAALHKEFEELMSFFSVWATASLQYDEDRAFKRLKTREAFIQHREQSLEEKQNHYIQVVTAFKSALALLGGP